MMQSGITAHAWVEIDGTVIIGGQERDRYTQLKMLEWRISFTLRFIRMFKLGRAHIDGGKTHVWGEKALQGFATQEKNTQIA